MSLSSDLVSQFTKITNDSKRDATAVTLRGVIEKHDEIVYVKLDGSDELTPITRTVEVAEGDRVEVTIANHAATVTGNLSDPSIGVVRANGLETKIEQTADAIRFELKNEITNMYTHVELTADGIRSEVSEQVTNLSNNITNVENGIRDDLGADILTLSADLANMDSAIREDFAEDLSDLNDTITEVDQNIRKDFDADIATMNATVEKIQVDVTNLDSKITQTASEIRSEVSADVENINISITDMESSIRNDMNAKDAELDSKITQTATSIRSEVSANVTDINTSIENVETGIRNDMNAKDAELDSKITQTATSIKSEVDVKITDVDGRVTELNTKVVQNSTSIATLVQNDAEFSEFKQTVEGFSFMGKGGTVKISGGDLTLTGSISFEDFNSDTQLQLEATETAAINALQNASTAQDTADGAQTTANDAFNQAIAAYELANEIDNRPNSYYWPTYITETYIDSTQIKSPRIEGNDVIARTAFKVTPVGSDESGNEVELPCGSMGLAFGETLDESGNSVTTYGVAMASASTTVNDYGAITVESTGYYVIVTNAGVRIQAGENSSFYVTDDGAYYNGVKIGTGEGGIAVFG